MMVMLQGAALNRSVIILLDTGWHPITKFRYQRSKNAYKGENPCAVRLACVAIDFNGDLLFAATF